ncbi:Hexosyltransferase [Fasciola hepatica]|uniref:Hexosyltransferase n=1 Tax=Fasciola hepatica TaxID=6192 RepID=A0A4E0R9B9_FASHE|nr:Hexosyltransferase [Fasciola hepatica]
MKVANPSRKLRKLPWVFGILLLMSIHYVYCYLCNHFAISDDLIMYPLNVNLNDTYTKLSLYKTWMPNVHSINPANFPLIRAPLSLCEPVLIQTISPENKTYLDILFVIKSRLHSFDQRRTIRNTWSNATCALMAGARIQTVFALGTTASPESALETKLHEEHDRYNDLLQFGFVDSYYNNTYKIMTALDYISRTCQDTKFVIIVDDDFLVNLNNIIQTISEVTTAEYSTYISGLVFYTQQPDRRPWSKWFVSYKEYPYRLFPPYPSGGTVVISMPVVRLLAAGMPFVKFFWIDDAYMGIVLYKYGIIPKLLPGVYLPRVATESELPGMISSHGFDSAAKMEQGWQRVVQTGACVGSDSKRHRWNI